MNAHPRARAFTIIEMLVVIGILSLLLGILLPALSGAKKRSSKQTELNSLRQIGFAWTLYANGNNDKLLPGFIEADVQEKWRVAYLYPSRIPIQPSPNFASGDPNIAGPWPWRLLPFLDNSLPTVYGYVDDPHLTRPSDGRTYPIFDTVTLDPRQIGTQLNMEIIGEAAIPIAYAPSFGYNAYYVGGWWEMVTVAGTDVPRYRFYDARADRNGDGSIDDNERANVVSRSAGTIRRPSQLVIFCSSAPLEPGVYRKFQDSQRGSHFVVPPVLGTEDHWRLAGQTTSAALGGVLADADGLGSMTTGGTDPNTISVQRATSPPIGRYTGQAATLHADGHTAVNSPQALLDMRLWIDAASTVGYTHE